MTAIDSLKKAVELPRHLVLEVLHRAQIASPEACQGLLVRNAAGELALLDIPADAVVSAVATGLAVRAQEPLAFYHSSPATDRPSLEQASHWLDLAPLYLSVALGVRGVLQLRGWRREAGELQEVELELDGGAGLR